MRVKLILSYILVLFLILPASAQEGIDSSSGRVEVPVDTTENTVSVPVNEETGMVDWQDYMSLPAGGGANWGFVTTLYPPDPVALADCPEILLDGAWFPPIPFSFGFAPSGEYSVITQGWWYLDDGSGYLARRDMNVTSGLDTWFASTWFMGCGWAYHAEQDWTEGFLGEGTYMPDEWTGPGIEYFLRSVWFRGVLEGERMQQLLTLCSAQRIGRDMMNGGRDRLAIFQVPPNELDRQNGRGSLLVWLKVGEWQIVRTRLHAAYAIEVTQFENISVNVENNPQVFYSDFLPSDVFWSIDQYLLTHDTTGPFFEFSDYTFNAPDLTPFSNLESETEEDESSEEIDASDGSDVEEEPAEADVE